VSKKLSLLFRVEFPGALYVKFGTPALVVLSGAGPSSLVAKALPSDLPHPAKIAAQQMRYFGLVALKCSFDELFPSATRARASRC